MKTLATIFALSLLVFGMTSTAVAQDQGKVFTNKENVAINGYDVVAYFNAYKAVEGNKKHSVELDGVTYYFSSAANAKTFKENPSAYQPAYGGYCAFAMAMNGSKVPVDPTTFKIRDGKLYLFFNDLYKGEPMNTIIPWNAQEAELVGKADANWSKS